jgi:RNA polymerase sigma factor (sigma-70 family)
MQDSAVRLILDGLQSDRSREAWAEFLDQHGVLIFQTCQRATSSADQAGDSFLFVCEQLSQDNFRRLLRFRLEGPASFSTWLRVVVRHLCLDWRRHEFGRLRLFRSIARLSQLGGEVYRCRYERGLSLDDTYLSLRPSFPGLTVEQVVSAEEQVHASLNARQLWLISTRKTQIPAQTQQPSLYGGAPTRELADPRPDQESLLADREEEARLWSVVDKLPRSERLLIRMRFKLGLSLEEISSLTRLGNPQRVHRKIAEIIEKLRRELT